MKNEFFEKIKSSMEEVIDVLENNKEVVIDTINVNPAGLILGKERKMGKISKINKKKETEELENIVIILDILYESGLDCINPITNEIVLDNEYDAFKKELYNENPDSKILSGVTSISCFDDKVKKWLKKLDPKSDIFSLLKSSKEKIIHNPPMTSISKCNGSKKEKEEILYKWFEDCRKIDTNIFGKKHYPGWLQEFFCMSFKHDGVALSLEYEKGKLIKAGLRSQDGIYGENVTKHTKYIKNIPQQLSLPITCRIRGEIECLKSVFETVNKNLSKEGKDVKANPRNHTAGVMHREYPQEVVNMGLSFKAYNILGLEDPPYKTEIERAKWAKEKLGINFTKTVSFCTTQLDLWEENHRLLDFLVDGVVISINDLEYQEKAGKHGNSISANPKGKIAWKFEDEVKKSIVKNIIWQTGRTGNITPVLHFDGIDLEGTIVSKCTAHNVGIVKNNCIGIGSEIEIIKSGKIIPKIKKVIKPSGTVVYPDLCPSCEEKTILTKGNNGTESLVCHNNMCSAKRNARYCHFLSVIGIKGIAESTINKMIDSDLVKSLSDFYKLDLPNLIDVGFTPRVSLLILARLSMMKNPESIKDNENLFKEIKSVYKIKKIKIPMATFIASLGINGAGKEVGRILSSKYSNIDDVFNLSIDNLNNIDGIGPITSNNIVKFLTNNRKEIIDLLGNFELEVSKSGGNLEGKNFVFTGTFPGSKSTWKKFVEDNGGIIKGSVSKKIDYLVEGEEAGSKLKKAQNLNINIISLEELKEMVEK